MRRRVSLKIIYGSFNLYVWSDNALTDLFSYKILRFFFWGKSKRWKLICSGLFGSDERDGSKLQCGRFYHSMKAPLVLNYHANCELWTKIKWGRQFYPQDMMQPSPQSVPYLSSLLTPLLSVLTKHWISLDCRSDWFKISSEKLRMHSSVLISSWVKT